jgi:hypothetical protein
MSNASSVTNMADNLSATKVTDTSSVAKVPSLKKNLKKLRKNIKSLGKESQYLLHEAQSSITTPWWDVRGKEHEANASTDEDEEMLPQRHGFDPISTIELAAIDARQKVKEGLDEIARQFQTGVLFSIWCGDETQSKVCNLAITLRARSFQKPKLWSMCFET